MFLSSNSVQVHFADSATTELLIVNYDKLYFKTAESTIARTKLDKDLRIACYKMVSGLRDFLQTRLDYLKVFMK